MCEIRSTFLPYHFLTVFAYTSKFKNTIKTLVAFMVWLMISVQYFTSNISEESGENQCNVMILASKSVFCHNEMLPLLA